MTIGEKTYKLGYMSALGEKKTVHKFIVELSKTTPPIEMGVVYINTTGERIRSNFTSREVGERKNTRIDKVTCRAQCTPKDLETTECKYFNFIW